MRSRANYTISSRDDPEDHAGALIQDHREIQGHGPKCTSSVLLSVLFFAAARVSSIFDSCQRLLQAPSDQAIRNASDAGRCILGISSRLAKLDA